MHLQQSPAKFLEVTALQENRSLVDTNTPKTEKQQKTEIQLVILCFKEIGNLNHTFTTNLATTVLCWTLLVCYLYSQAGAKLMIYSQ